MRLSFHSVAGEELVITRNLQVTIKKGVKAPSMKTMEASLSVRVDSEKHTISSRVADLDEQVPLKLEPPRSCSRTLSFCHQDEALWPMSEPAALKKKFDEIFEVTKYSNAIQTLPRCTRSRPTNLRWPK